MNDDQASQLREATAADREEARLLRRFRCLAVGSGKGGVGKTMISIGLACCLAEMKYRVLIFDADLGLANVDLQIGVDPRFTLQDVIYGNCSLSEAVVTTPCGPDILAASSGAPEMADMGGARRQMLVEELIRFAANYDFLIIDVGAGISKSVTAFLAAAPEVMVVVANEPTSIMDAYSLIKILSQAPEQPAISLAINMVQSLEEGEHLAERLNAITHKFLNVELPVAGIVVYDPVVGDAIRARESIVAYAPGSAPAQCIREAAVSLATRKLRDQAAVGSADRSLFDKLAEMNLHPDSREAKI